MELQPSQSESSVRLAGEQAVEFVLQLLGGAMLRIILQYAAQAQSRFHQVAHLKLLLGELVQQLALVRCNASSGAAQAHDRRFALTHIGQGLAAHQVGSRRYLSLRSLIRHAVQRRQRALWTIGQSIQFSNRHLHFGPVRR